MIDIKHRVTKKVLCKLDKETMQGANHRDADLQDALVVPATRHGAITWRGLVCARKERCRRGQ